MTPSPKVLGSNPFVCLSASLSTMPPNPRLLLNVLALNAAPMDDVGLCWFLQVSKGKPLRFKRLEDILREGHRANRDETRIRRSKQRPPTALPPKNKLAFAVRIKE